MVFKIGVVFGGAAVKKGFSFVEISIVLVIIGLVMAMALKGKELITSSEIRKELNKFRKYEAAFTGTMMKTNKPYPIDLPATGNLAQFTAWSDDVCDLFIKQNYLKHEDKQMRYSSPTPVVFYPDLVTEADEGYSEPTSYLGQTFSVRLANVSDMFVCLVENMLDDRDMYNGTGKLFGNGIESFTDAQYSDCISLGTGNNDKTYGYMIFKN
jgi:prepilin-type N-terminal cleavage/methylation domain-containing protein